MRIEGNNYTVIARIRCNISNFAEYGFVPCMYAIKHANANNRGFVGYIFFYITNYFHELSFASASAGKAT